jgi:hypothetical protein
MTLPWGATHPWDAEDPRRPCFTCGEPPTGRFMDGSPRYGHNHPPVIHDPAWDAMRLSSLTYTLDADQVAAATRCAEQLVADSERRKDTWGGKALSREGRLANHTLGAAGEIAFSAMTGLPWACRAGRGFRKADVGRYQVRTIRTRNHYGAAIHDYDAGKPLVVMVGDVPTFRLAGWLRDATLAMTPGNYSDPGGRRPAWFVTPDALDSARTIPELADRG